MRNWVVLLALLLPTGSWAIDIEQLRCDMTVVKLSVMQVFNTMPATQQRGIAAIEIFAIEEIQTDQTDKLICEATLTTNWLHEIHIRYAVIMGKGGAPLVMVQPIEQRSEPTISHPQDAI